ncbi:hypothetical protein ACFO3J_05665 [Streptomyces polygonati]|uniref:AAA domain-containing protein n=1 Tax=Streptomyces polygonati TaxID=1617087 RepID=A0ABV8HJG8_9ACTN
MIVRINGTSGVGKTTTSEKPAALLPDALVFDSESVGYMLQPVFTGIPARDFQDHPAGSARASTGRARRPPERVGAADRRRR